MEISDNLMSLKVNEIIRNANINGIICINDFVKNEIEGKTDEEKLCYIDKCVDQLRTYLMDNNIKDFKVERYKEKSKNIINSTDAKFLLKFKYYLRKNKIKIVFIESINKFIEDIQSENKFESLRQDYQSYQSGNQNKQRISKMNKSDSYDFNQTDPLDILSKILKSYYYRGQSNVNYSIVPSIFRNGLISFEDTMYYELLSKCPNDFKECNRHIDILSKMQHYGMSTRMLDITTNPLVALFFAISGSVDYDGEFIFFDASEKLIKNNYSDTIEVLSALSSQSFTEKLELAKTALEYVVLSKNKKEIDFSKRSKLDGKEIDNFNKERTTEKLLHEIRMNIGDFNPKINPYDLFSPFFVQTIQNHDRIIRQDGMFIISGLPYFGGDRNIEIYNQLLDDARNNKKITGENQSQIIQSIANSININRSKEKNNREIRYIIPSQFKKVMTIDLSMMGINKKYLFPELDSLSKTLVEEYSVY